MSHVNDANRQRLNALIEAARGDPRHDKGTLEIVRRGQVGIAWTADALEGAVAGSAGLCVHRFRGREPPCCRAE
jgi:hypothetical protein